MRCRISIHTPHVGSDHSRPDGCLADGDFNPHSPCGERPLGTSSTEISISGFQSTLPMWGATLSAATMRQSHWEFQSTLPMWGATRLIWQIRRSGIFQSTLPMWGATAHNCKKTLILQFQSTLPMWGATRMI